MRKSFAIVVVLAAALLGCSGGSSPTAPTATAPDPSPIQITSARFVQNRVEMDIKWDKITLPQRNGGTPVPYLYAFVRSGLALRYLGAEWELPKGFEVAAGSKSITLLFQEWALDILFSKRIYQGDGVVVLISGHLDGVTGQNPELFLNDAELQQAGLGGKAEKDLSFPLR